MKPSKKPKTSGPLYEFHRPGRKPIIGRIRETGAHLGKRTAGKTERIAVEVERGRRRRKVFLAEKTFFNRIYNYPTIFIIYILLINVFFEYLVSSIQC